MKAICFFMSVWCLSVHLHPSMSQTAVKKKENEGLFTLHSPLSQCSAKRNLKNPQPCQQYNRVKHRHTVSVFYNAD